MTLVEIVTKEDLNEITTMIRALDSKPSSGNPMWVRTDEATKTLGITRQFLAQIRNERKITHSRLGKVVYYNLDSLYSYLSENAIQAVGS